MTSGHRHPPGKWTFSLLLLLLGAAGACAADLGEGTDLEIGGPGKGRGKFLQVMDLTFDQGNRLYVLDGVRWEKGAPVGNGLVQQFDESGNFLRQFSVLDPKLGDRNDPSRLAVDSRGNVYVSQPRAGLVQQYGPDGRLVRNYPVPFAHALTVRTVAGREQVLVVPNEYRNNQHVEVAELTVLSGGSTGEPLKLSRPVRNCQVIRADAAGNLYLQADLNQVYRFDPTGKLLTVLGGGTSLRVADGSELLAALALDSRGNLYANTFGNPSHVSRFTPDLGAVSQREGQFAWADAWGEQSLLAVDRHDRLWVAALGNTPGDRKYHYRPCVMRVEPGFFDPGKPGVSTHSTLVLGLHLAVRGTAPYDVRYDLAPTSFEMVVKASTRRVHRLTVKWVVHDLYRQEAARGQFELPLRDGAEARHSVSFTPPRWGWYTVTFETSEDGTPLLAVGRHLGVTPAFPDSTVLKEGESPGGWEDAPRQAFAGLPLQRVHTNQPLDRIDREVELAARYGLTLLVQFENRKECTPERVREVVGHFKGRVKYWEVMNEPNFSMKPEEYVALLRELYPLIKGIDPEAQVLGPTVCGIQLPWYEAFYRLGGKELTDILSIHDYEGNEAIDPGHWVWKVGELRQLMARYGDAGKPIWQTERAIGGVRAGNFLGGVQAVRVTLHEDLLETLGIPAEHNLHYYLNQGGYGPVPTYLWSEAGPHPGALATRTRQAMIRGRRFTGALDFGPTGNKMFLGLRYQGPDGVTVTLRSLGMRRQELELPVKGGGPLAAVDAFGNEQTLPVRDGKVALTLSTMPLYLRLGVGQDVSAFAIDFGRNYARQATFSYSAPSTGDWSILNNGILEAPHPGDPHPEPWSGSLPDTPQALEMQFPHPRTVDRVLVFGVRADNPYCALLDYDLQYHDGREWVTVAEGRSPMPPSDRVRTPQCEADTWYMDENFFVNQFRPVRTDRLRLVARRTTHGFMPDEVAVQAAGWSANAPHLMLREVEVYGPAPPVTVTFAAPTLTRTEAFEHEPVAVTVRNRSGAPVRGRAVVTVPEGWQASPAVMPVAAGDSQGLSFQVRSPAGPIPAGPAEVNVTLTDARGQVLDFDRLTVQVAAPVAVSPKPPGRIDAGRQELPVAIKNLTGRPVSGKVRVELTPAEGGPGDKALVAEVPFGPVAANQDGTVQPAVPGLDLMASGWHATFTVTCEGLQVTARQDLARVRRWQVLGPFPNLTGRAFDKDFGPEQGVDLDRAYPIGEGAPPVRWKPALTSTSGYLDLNRLFQPNILVCAYAVTYVRSPSARQALISAGSDDGGKTWVNGRLVLSRPGSRSAAPGQDKAEVELKAGWNEVLFKVPQSHGGWGFYFDLLTPDGKPMPDQVYSATRGGP